MRRHFAGNDVVRMTNRKTIYINVPIPSIFESLDPIWREAQIQIEWPVLQLYEVLPPLNLRRLAIIQRKSKFAESCNQATSVVCIALHEQVGVLRGIRKPQQDRSGFPYKQV